MALIRADIAKGVQKNILQAELINAGMPAPHASTLVKIACPPEETASELAKAERHNEKAGYGTTINKNELASIVRGKETVASILQKKEDKRLGKRETHARTPEQGNKGDKPATPAPAAKLTRSTFQTALKSLLTQAESDGIKRDILVSIASDVLADFEAGGDGDGDGEEASES